MRGAYIPAIIARQPWQVIVPLLALTLFGSTVLYSAAGGHFQPWAMTHTARFVVFMVMAMAIARVPQEWFKRIALPSYVLLCVLLVLVELIGGIGGGSQRWLNLGFMTLQPSELMKPGIVLVLAWFYSVLPVGETRTWRAVFPAVVLLGIPAGLVILQPDLGTGLAISFGAIVMMFLAGLPLWYFLSGLAAAAVVGPLAFFTVLHDYQRKRVLVFLDPESDPLGSGYHITQSKIAIGSGGFFGKGFGHGSQSHLDYLPEAHTDFVFATMAEEWGMIGGLFVLAVFTLVLRWGLKVAGNAPDRFSRLLAAGMVFTIFFYVCINLMMVMGLAPVVGIPLPFMSHGGSSMMTNMICIGTIMAVDRWSKRGGSGLL
jgi:rod shape determining protein RodA